MSHWGGNTPDACLGVIVWVALVREARRWSAGPQPVRLLPPLQVACEYGMVHVVSERGGPRGKDYCILYNPQWAHLPHDLSKAVSARGALRLADRRPSRLGPDWPLGSAPPTEPAEGPRLGSRAGSGRTPGAAGGCPQWSLAGPWLPGLGMKAIWVSRGARVGRGRRGAAPAHGVGRFWGRGLATCHLHAASGPRDLVALCPCCAPCAGGMGCACARVWEPMLTRPACPPPPDAPE